MSMSLTDTDFLLLILLLLKRNHISWYLQQTSSSFFPSVSFSSSFSSSSQYGKISFAFNFFHLMRTFTIVNIHFISVLCCAVSFQHLKNRLCNAYDARRTNVLHFKFDGFMYQLGSECENKAEERSWIKCVKLYAYFIEIR